MWLIGMMMVDAQNLYFIVFWYNSNTKCGYSEYISVFLPLWSSITAVTSQKLYSKVYTMQVCEYPKNREINEKYYSIKAFLCLKVQSPTKLRKNSRQNRDRTRDRCLPRPAVNHQIT